MGSSMLHPQAALHDAALPAQREALLGLLSTSPLPLDAIADRACDDPVLAHALLRSQPLEHGGLDVDLHTALRLRIERIGPDLLSAWLSTTATRPPPTRTDLALRGFARRTSDIAHRIAQAIGHAQQDEARLAGMWSRLGQMLRLDPEHGSLASTNARLAESCGCTGPIADALALADCSEEQIVSAHPLARLLWCAARIAAPEGAPALAVLARVSGVDLETLRGIRDTTREMPQDATLVPVGSTTDPSGSPAAAAAAAAAAPTLLEAALRGYVHSAFDGLDPVALRQRYRAASRLLCATQPALVVIADQDHLRALPLLDGTPDAWFDDSRPKLDDEASVLSLAVRSASPTSYHRDDAQPPGRSMLDWQLARWLGRSGFVCIPFSSRGVAGAVIIAPDRVQMPPRTRHVR